MNERLKLSGNNDFTEFCNPWSKFYYDKDHENDGDNLSDISSEDEFDLDDDSEDIVVESNNINNFDKMVIE